MKSHRITLTHIILFLLTMVTTIVAGATQVGVNPLENPEQLYKGIPFSFTLMLFLVTHELGHYITSRIHRTPATLPYFIPGPPIITGTFGAFIKMQPPLWDRRSLIDIGASGPLLGFIIAVAATIIGLMMSEIKPSEIREGTIFFGNSLIFGIMTELILPLSSRHHDVVIHLHPVAFAGWLGFFITSLNLLPIGQLDGGHITYAISQRGHRFFSVTLVPILLVLGFFTWSGWTLWAVLMLVLGIKHPPVVYPEIPLDRKRKIIGWLSFIVFILTFTPEPFRIV
jgi:membrane-associated protease RseP (regulator of RpoE activity)